MNAPSAPPAGPFENLSFFDISVKKSENVAVIDCNGRKLSILPKHVNLRYLQLFLCFFVQFFPLWHFIRSMQRMY